jgi:hypothetical protein
MPLTPALREVKRCERQLRPPLRFGNDEQIRALRFLTEIAEFRDHLKTCGNCASYRTCSEAPRISHEAFESAWELEFRHAAKGSA